MQSADASKDYLNKGLDMADGFDFANLGQMFGPGIGGTPTGIDALLSEEQRKLLGRNAAMSAAAALLQAGGPSRTPINLGQALGGALQAGQAGYQQARAGALQDVMLGEKLKEAQREREMQDRYTKMFAAGGAPAGMTPAQAALAAPVAAAGPVGPTTARAGLAAQMPEQAPTLMQSLTPEQRVLLGSMTPKQGIPELLKMSSAMTEFGEPKPFVVNGKTVMIQTNKMGQTRVVPNVMPYEAQSPDIRAVEYISGRPLAGTGAEGIQQVGQYRQQIAPRTQVNIPDMTGGQKGFENEMKLGGAFKGEPIYKEFNDMKSAFGQVISSLSAGTPIGDVAGATKVMKLLDPGSVVRESELAIAMQAGGRMDRLQNYFNNMMTGQKLTPTQREDFKALANELYAAAADAYNKKRKEYENFGQAYKFKNLGTALGEPALVPSIMRGGAGRKPLGEIFGG